MAATTLTSFHKFPELAPELRDRIWQLAVQKPKVFTLRIPWDSSDPNNDQYELAQCPSSLATACRASRHIFQTQAHTDIQLPIKHKNKYFNPGVDTISIDVFQELSLEPLLQKISKLGIESLGLPCGHGKPIGILFSGANANMFTGLKEIVVILGRIRVCGELELVAVNETTSKWNPPLVQWAEEYADFLRADMEKISKKWKRYQRKRVRQGKSSPDWVLPSVRLAFMMPMNDEFLYAN
jgi:hypothetical protein